MFCDKPLRDKPLEDYSTLHRGPRHRGPAKKVCNRGGRARDNQSFDPQPYICTCIFITYIYTYIHTGIYVYVINIDISTCFLSFFIHDYYSFWAFWKPTPPPRFGYRGWPEGPKKRRTTRRNRLLFWGSGGPMGRRDSLKRRIQQQRERERDTYIYIYILYTHTYIYMIYVYVYIYILVCMCVRLYVHIHICMHIYMQTYTRTQCERWKKGQSPPNRRRVLPPLRLSPATRGFRISGLSTLTPGHLKLMVQGPIPCLEAQATWP